jgi:hypothetical protein
MSSKQKDTREFTVDGVEYMVRQPSPQDFAAANKLRNKVFNEELQAGSLLRSQLDEELRKRELWSDDRDLRYKKLSKEITDGEYILAKGGIKASKAKEIALDMRNKRQEMITLLSTRTELDSNTCEGRADSARFNCLFLACLVYKANGELYFKGGLDEFLSKQNDEVTVTGSTEFFYLISDLQPVDDNLPENKFLKRFNFIDSKGNLIDKDGKLISADGRHINEDGQFITWISETEYVKVDIEGRPLKDDDEFDVDSSPFLDDDGKPIEESPSEIEPKKRTRKKVSATTSEVS